MTSPANALTDSCPERSGHAPAPPRKQTGALLAVLAALTAISPLAIDMYVPAFPEMGRALSANSSAVQLTMTAFLLGLVVGQLVIGPLSDGIGRRKLLIGGSVGFVVFSVVCALAPSAPVLTGARFLQGLAGAAGMVLTRAIITDRFEGADIPRHFGMLAQVIGVTPILAPVAGGAVLSVATWRTVFVVLAVVGVLLLLATLAKVPESLPAAQRRQGGVGATFRAMGGLLGNRPFMGFVLVLGFSSAAMFTYISGSSFVFQELHDVSTTTYSLIFATNGVGLLIAGGLFGRLGRTVRMNTLLVAGSGVAALGALLQVLLVLLVGESLVGTWVSLFVTLVGVGIIIPATLSLGQSVARQAPGAASALLGASQFLMGGIASPLVGLFGEGSSAPMAWIMLIGMALAVLCLVTLARPWRGHGEVTAPGEAH